MTNLIKIDFSPISDYLIDKGVDDDLLDQFEILTLSDKCKLEDFTEDSFFEWFADYFNNSCLNEIDNFITNYSLPLSLSLYLALYKTICENSSTLENFFDEGDSLANLIIEDCYSIKNIDIEDINIKESFKINHSTFFIKNDEADAQSELEKFNQLCRFIQSNIPNLIKQIQLLNALTEFNCVSPTNNCIFIYSKPEKELAFEDLISKLKLYSIIVNGKIIHKPVTVSNITYQNLDISFENSNDSSVQYRQFDDIANLLSQFNSENRLLSKFLILYQILENFEIKHDIVKVMNSGGQFKVRDFTKLVNSSPSNEKKYLKKLLKELLDLDILEIGRKVSILQLIKEMWDTNIPGNFNFTYLNTQLKQIGYDNVNTGNFNTQVRNLNKDDIVNFLTESIYMTRCSIVHYKTHEFHLNDGTLENMAELKLFLTDFLVPLLHKIISISILSDISPVAYPDNKLILF